MPRKWTGSTISEIAREMSLSPQRVWALAQVANGRCRICGKKRNKYAHVCNACGIKEYRRRKVAREKT